MLVQPGVSHQGRHDVVLGSQHVWLVVDPLAVGQTAWSTAEGMHLARALRAAGNVVLAINLREQVRDLFQRMRAHDRGEPFAASRIRTACIDLVLAVAAGLQAQQEPRDISPATIEAIGIIHRHLDQPLTVDQIAERVGLSASRFHQRFLADTGETPAAHYLRLRCQRAASLSDDRARALCPVDCQRHGL